MKTPPSLAAFVLALPAALAAQAPEHVPANLPVRIQHQLAQVRAEDQRGPFHADWNSLAAYRTPEWFQDAKFGIFLHWGVYSVPAFGNEWYSRNMYVPGNVAFKHQVAIYGPQTNFGYKDFIPMFKAEHFDPNAWVDLFAQAGARYVVPVAEHCDGFAMYDSQFTDWDSAKMGPHRDVVGEIAIATRAHGVHFGASSHRAEHWWWYGLGRTFPSDVQDPRYAGLYAPAAKMALPGTLDDTKEPDPSHFEQWLPPDKAFLDDWLARSTEIVDKYHPEFFYFDWWDGQPEFVPYLRQFAAYYYNRSAQRHEHPVLTYKIEAMPANTATLDIERGKLDSLRLLPWQTDTSISIHSWGYVEHDEYRNAESLVHQLIDTVAKNGNLLLNVGPESDGTIPDQARAVLLKIGAWLKVNGESIYDTRPFSVFGEGPTKTGANPQAMQSDIQTFTPEDIRFSIPKTESPQSPSILYATALGWPAAGTLRIHILGSDLPYLPHAVCSVSLLGHDGPLSFTRKPEGLFITLPRQRPNDIAFVFRISAPETCHSTR
jgi:alpha-L-fucosidase